MRSHKGTTMSQRKQLRRKGRTVCQEGNATGTTAEMDEFLRQNERAELEQSIAAERNPARRKLGKGRRSGAAWLGCGSSLAPRCGRPPGRDGELMRRLLFFAVLVPAACWLLWASCQSDDYRDTLPLRSFDAAPREGGAPSPPVEEPAVSAASAAPSFHKLPHAHRRIAVDGGVATPLLVPPSASTH
mgnify:CR=1 FL=1